MKRYSARPFRHRFCGEAGVSVPIAALAMTVIMGLSALVVDVGHGWRTRRALIPATDAAALAAAQEYATGGLGPAADCDAIAATYLANNETAASLDGCDPFSYSAYRGRVTVSASHNVETWFAPVLGLGDYEVSSTSTATWGPPLAATGLRPIGLCLVDFPELQALLEAPPGSPSVVLEVLYNKDQPDPCGLGAVDSDLAGNWGTIDFTGTGRPSIPGPELKDWVENGYEGEVFFGRHNPQITSCAGDNHCYQTDPGGLSGAQNELRALRDSGRFFTLPVFDFADLQGRSRVHLAGIIRARLIDFKVVGNQQSRFFVFEVLPGLVTGTCCGGGGGAGGNQVIALCGVDPNEFGACDP